MSYPDNSYARRSWFRGSAGVFIRRTSGDTVPVVYTARAAHCEILVSTNSSFGGVFSIYAIPASADVNSSALGIWVDGVFNQTVTFDVGAGLNKQQVVTVNVGTSGAHTIRIQEGDRDTGVAVTRIAVDGVIANATAIVRSWKSWGDSVSMGVNGVPRSIGWAEKMKGSGSRFDSVANLGKSGYSLNTAVLEGITSWVNLLVPATAGDVGSTENVISLCMGINDWFPSVNSVSAATHQTNLNNLVTALKARADLFGLPGFKLMLHSLTYVQVASRVANAQGSTPSDFNAAIQAVATANPAFCTFLDVFSGAGLVDGDMADAIHPNNTGHSKTYTTAVAAI